MDYRVTNARKERAKEAVVTLSYLSYHDMRNGRILDIGCGNGSTTNWFSHNVQTCSIGVDVRKTPRRFPQKETSNVEYMYASGLGLPFIGKSFHTVILNDVLEHVAYQDAITLFNEISKVLDDDGKLYVSVANKYQIMEPHSGLLLISWFPSWVYRPVIRKVFGEEVYPYTVKRFGALVKKAHFLSDNFTWYYVSKKIHNLNYIGNRIIRPLVRVFNKMRLTSSLGFRRFLEGFAVLVFVCQKTSTAKAKFSLTAPRSYASTQEMLEFISEGDAPFR